MSDYSINDAEDLIRAARGVIELHGRSPHFEPEMIEKQFKSFNKKEKVFVRLMHYPTNTIRGTSEISEQSIPMIRAVINAVLSAGFGSQNNIPVSSHEIDELIIELNIISEPIPLTGSYISKRNDITIGKHGLILKYGSRKGVVLPSYAIDNNLDRTHFLEAACIAAGLEKDHWKQPKVELYRFESQRFIEESPNGKVKIL